MKRKQVMAMLLALSMAAANVVTVPVDAHAKIVFEGTVAENPTTENQETTVKLLASVKNTDVIYISAEEAKEGKTIKVAPDGNEFEKIMIKPAGQQPSKASQL